MDQTPVPLSAIPAEFKVEEVDRRALLRRWPDSRGEQAEHIP